MKYRVEVRTYPLDIQNIDERYIYENIKFDILASKLHIRCKDANIVCSYAGKEYNDVSKIEFEIVDIRVVADVFIIYENTKIRLEFMICEDIRIIDHNFPMNSRINGTKKLFIYFDYSKGDYYKYVDFLHPTLNIELPCDYISMSSYSYELGNAFIMSESHKIVIFSLIKYLVDLSSNYEEVIIMGSSIGTTISMLLKNELPNSKLIIAAPATSIFTICSNMFKTPSMEFFTEYSSSLVNKIKFTDTIVFTSEYDHHYDEKLFTLMKENGAIFNTIPREEKVEHDKIMQKYKKDVFNLILDACS